MAGGDHRCIRVRPITKDHRESAAKRVLANLEVVLVDEGEGSEAEVREEIPSCGPARLAQFRSINQDEPDSETAIDVQGIAINDSGHLAFDAEAIRSRTLRVERGWSGREPDSDEDAGYSDHDHHSNEDDNPYLPPNQSLNPATLSHALKSTAITNFSPEGWVQEERAVPSLLYRLRRCSVTTIR